jgi:3-methyladenine DNA glycosylase AlkD
MHWRSLLEPHANPEAAVPMAAYMKHHFPFLGIPQPVRKAATRQVVKEAKSWCAGRMWAAVEELWAQPEREFHYLAIELLTVGSTRLDADDLPWIESLARRHSWWDSIDALCSPLVGSIVARQPEAGDWIEAHWAGHEDFWVRRMAILYQRREKAGTDEARLFRICLANAEDKNFFIRKGIGWALREYAKTSPAVVAAFLEHNSSRFSPLTLREASKYLREF